jgi:hypothetical protein
MCRPWDHQAFVFVKGAFAVRSAVGRGLRTDGALSEIRFPAPSAIRWSFSATRIPIRFCCPSRLTTVRYRIERRPKDRWSFLASWSRLTRDGPLTRALSLSEERESGDPRPPREGRVRGFKEAEMPACYHALHAAIHCPEDGMTPTDLCYTPATKLIPLIRSRKLSPVELTKAVLERIEKLNPKLNAFCTITADDAMKAARAAEQAVMKKKKLGPIHGIPFSVKDLSFTKGVRTMGGSHLFADRVPDHDAPYVRRLKAAGGILTGKTTNPEFGWKALSGYPLTGDTHNPWNLAMNTGGSERGAARRPPRDWVSPSGLGRSGLHPGAVGLLRVRPQALLWAVPRGRCRTTTTPPTTAPRRGRWATPR